MPEQVLNPRTGKMMNQEDGPQLENLTETEQDLNNFTSQYFIYLFLVVIKNGAQKKYSVNDMFIRPIKACLNMALLERFF